MPKYRQEELETIARAYSAGRALADAGRLEAAIVHFDSVLGKLPRRRRDRVYRIESPMATGRDDVSWLPSIFREVLLAKAFCLNELGRFADASALLERAVELDPENPRVYAELGFANGSLEQLEKAHAAYTTALALEPDNPAHLRALAQLALLKEDFAEARDLCCRSLALEPDSIPTLHQLGYAEYRLGEVTEAIARFTRAVELAPADADNMLRLAGLLRETGRGRAAIDQIEAFLQTAAGDAELYALLTDLLQQAGTPAEMIRHAQRLLARNAADPVAYDMLAWGYHQDGHAREALAALTMLARLEPAQAFHQVKLGMLYQALGDLPRAMAALQRALALDEQGDAGRVAREVIHTLDHAQLEQIVARARADAAFALRLQLDPEVVLYQAGFLLSPSGLLALESLDWQAGEVVVPVPASRMVQ